jgi:putative peptidoglycan lipid II flippase
MSSRLARSAGLIGLATMASRILGVVREAVLAAYFGAGTQMDAYNVAFRVPNLVRDLFAEGAMTAAFIPTFTRRLSQDGREPAWRLGNLVINALLLATGTFVILGIIFAHPITRTFAPEFATVPGKLALTANLTRAMWPFLLTVAVAVAMMGMLNSLHRFFIPALSPVMFNVATIACTVALVPVMPRMGLPPIAAVAFGTILGGIGQVAIQWPVLRAEGFRYRLMFDWRDPDLRTVLRLMGPGTLGLAAVQINVAVNTYLATGQQEGAVSWLSYAFRVMYLPIGLFGVSIATAVLPDIARQAAADDIAGLRRTVSGAIRMMLMLNVPAAAGLTVLAYPIVSLLLERNRFTPADTAATATALMFYAPGLLGYSTVKIISPTFYSLGNSRIPATISVVTVALNLALNMFLVRVMGFAGLALGTTIAALFNAAALTLALDQRIGGLERAPVITAFVKIVAASIVMGLAAVLVSRWSETLVPGSSTAIRAVRVAASIGTGMAVLVVFARLLRMAEFDEARARVLRRFVPR